MGGGCDENLLPTKWGIAAPPAPMEVQGGKKQLEVAPWHHKVGSALFYGVSSFAIMFVNKIVLSTYGFKSFNFLALCQFLVTAVVLFTLKVVGKVKVAPVSWETLRIMAPLCAISLINVIMGLGGTQRVSLPMFTVLRRFSILMTMVLERYLLHVRASPKVQLSVFLMIFGSFIAAISDLAFDMQGYTMILICDMTTALNGVVMKMVLTSSSLSKMSVIFHNSWISAMVMLVVLWLRPEEMAQVRAFPHWHTTDFLVYFVLASLMGSILNYATFLCTALNSALTTTVVGCLKNVLTTYLGMVFLPDYIFSWSNFLGLNISIAGSLLYSWAEFVSKEEKRRGGGGGGASDLMKDRGGLPLGQQVAAAAGHEGAEEGGEERARLLESAIESPSNCTEANRRVSRTKCEVQGP